METIILEIFLVSLEEEIIFPPMFVQEVSFVETDLGVPLPAHLMSISSTEDDYKCGEKFSCNNLF